MLGFSGFHPCIADFHNLWDCIGYSVETWGFTVGPHPGFELIFFLVAGTVLCFGFCVCEEC